MTEMVETQKAIRAAKVAKYEDEEDKREEKWVKYYSSFHHILFVGEGDFCFSTSLAQSFGSASNIVASSLDSYDDAIRKYKHAKSNFDILEKLGASLLHGVDVTDMKLHTDLKMHKFDRIIYNFPHAGFHGKEDGIRLINMHRNLVGGFFRNASHMLRANGEIHVNHKTTTPFCYWNLEELGTQNSLVLIETVAFKKEDYPGYNNKRGSGLRCDESFPLGECCTFKFIFFPTAKKVTKEKKLDLPIRRPRELVEAPIYVPKQPNTSKFIRKMNEIRCKRSHELIKTPRYTLQQPNYLEFRQPQPPSSFIPLMPRLLRGMGPLPTESVSMECSRIFRGYFKHMETFGGHEALRLDYERDMTEEPGKTVSGYICVLEELYHFFIARQEWASRMLVALEFHRIFNSVYGPFTFT